ncbi:SLC13 family permease [Gynuella sunshinyii]|uniref:Di-and tricarboxylate transporter n=1 Tax=Gynuella sunshinyii YC6258 TaxID=1445510 RepID=A0A0C5VRU0_9GAMM|nr:DASS family sodium-coupled anion symporter [Gynuella sunshinyii]AJQ96951.1 Di- and tricarboxylate transporter [Gynuella sunshinyii YC6258]
MSMHVKQENRSWFGLLLGPVVMLMIIILPAPAGLSEASWLTIGLTFWMASWWITEAVPIPVTSFLPLVVAPLLRINHINAVAVSYAHPLIFLFMGGFMLSIAMERWSLHKRIALKTMLLTGSKPSQQIAGIMLVTAFLSMWMSNTATTVMMLPIGLSIIQMTQTDEQTDAPYNKALLLSIAYAASIGGLATLIGTPPNALMAAYLNENFHIKISFARWMLVGIPLTVLLLFSTWLWLTQMFYQVDKNATRCSKVTFRLQLNELGPVKREETAVLIIFALTALAWMFRPLIAKITGLPLDDTIIAMLSASLLFACPIDRHNRRLLKWKDATKVPWGVLLLFGGGLSLAGLIKSSGLADYIALQVEALDAMPLWLMTIIVVTVIVFLTEITSNTATAAGFLPLLGPIAMSISNTPMTLVIPAAIAASCAFMMPVATPPNAIIFSSGQLRIADMAKTGLMLNLIAIFWISLLGLTLVRWVLNF